MVLPADWLLFDCGITCQSMAKVQSQPSILVLSLGPINKYVTDLHNKLDL